MREGAYGAPGRGTGRGREMTMTATMKQGFPRHGWVEIPKRELMAWGRMDAASAGKRVKEFAREAVEGRGGSLANRANDGERRAR